MVPLVDHKTLQIMVRFHNEENEVEEAAETLQIMVRFHNEENEAEEAAETRHTVNPPVGSCLISSRGKTVLE